jgi:hypothetical protein
MSISISAPMQALSQVKASAQASAPDGASALDSLLQMFTGPTGQSPQPATLVPFSPNSISPANAFDPGTFNALLSIQEQANGAGQIGNAADSSDADTGMSGASPTTDTVTNPDGSTTTTLTYADGTQQVMTTPALQPIGAAATDLATNAVSKNLEQLGDLLGPLASAALVALI